MTSGSNGRGMPGGSRGSRNRLGPDATDRRPDAAGRRAGLAARRPEIPGPATRLSKSTLWDEGDQPSGPQPLRARWDPVPPPKTPPAARKTRPQRRRSAIGWFVHHYGWRAYALPVLAALTVVAVVQLTGSPEADPAGAGPAVSGTGSVTVTVGSSVPTTVTVEKPGPTTTVGGSAAITGASSDPAPNTAQDPNGTFHGVAAGVLPPGAAFAKTGAGTFHVVPGTAAAVGTGSDHRTYAIEVEDGIQSTANDQLFADAVVRILSDSRSWIGGGQFTLQRIDHGTPDFRISLTSQMTVRAPHNCGWQIQLEASCYNRLDGRVFVNDARWVRGAVSYNGDLLSYRVYAINHEVGHALGFHHQPCPEDGGLAPVMMQQSWSTADDDLATLDPKGVVAADGKVCKPNPFPYPRGPAGSGTGTAGSGTGTAGSGTGTAAAAATGTAGTASTGSTQATPTG